MEPAGGEKEYCFLFTLLGLKQRILQACLKGYIKLESQALISLSCGLTIFFF